MWGRIFFCSMQSLTKLDTIAKVYNKVLKYEESEVNITPGVRIIRLRS